MWYSVSHRLVASLSLGRQLSSVNDRQGTELLNCFVNKYKAHFISFSSFFLKSRAQYLRLITLC